MLNLPSSRPRPRDLREAQAGLALQAEEGRGPLEARAGLQLGGVHLGRPHVPRGGHRGGHEAPAGPHQGGRRDQRQGRHQHERRVGRQFQVNGLRLVGETSNHLCLPGVEST